VHDPIWGETPLADVVPRDPAHPPRENDIEAFSRGRLAAYKRPRHLAIVAELPRNAGGKVLKTQLREEYVGWAGRPPTR
jgi:fatty-acyl-CoA synthase